MKKKYSSWSLNELKKERLKIDQAIKIKEKRDKKATLAKMIAIAKQNGFELNELLDDPTLAARKQRKTNSQHKPVRPRGKVAPKYQNPLNTEQKWTGRGRQPKWVKEQLEGGSELEDLLINAGSEA